MKCKTAHYTNEVTDFLLAEKIKSAGIETFSPQFLQIHNSIAEAGVSLKFAHFGHL
jgi:hypothetical protein